METNQIAHAKQQNTQIMLYSETQKNTLTPLQAQMVLANKEIRIIELSDDKIIEFAGKLITDALVALAQKNTFDGAGRIAAQVKIMNDLRLFKPYFTTKEIEIAIAMGCNGEFSKNPDDLITFSPSKVIRWVNAFAEKRNEAIILEKEEQKRLAKIEAQAQMRINEKKHLNQQWKMLCVYVEEFGELPEKPEKTIRSLFRVFYERLTEYGYNVSVEERWDIVIFFRHFVVRDMTHMEGIMFGGHFREIWANIDSRQEIFANNFFGSKAISLAKEKCFHVLFWKIHNETPEVLAKIEF